MERIIQIPLNRGLTNVYLIKGSRNCLVDTGTAANADEILKKMIEHGVRPCELDLIILTHNHPDHSGGLAQIKKAANARVLMHKSEAALLEKGETENATPNGLLIRIMSNFMGSTRVTPVRAEITVDEEYDLLPLGIEGRLISMPGHTQGSIAVVLSDGQIIVGDTFNAKNNKVELPFFVNDKKTLMESIGRLSQLENASVYYTSHGKTCEPAALATFLSRYANKA